MGRSIQNRPIVVERFGRTGPVVFLFHTIHGNEVPAEQCGERMHTWLLSHPEAYQDLQVLFATQVNPDGFAMGTRFNANEIDLNRNFPASNFEPSDTFGPSPASEPETQVLVALMEDTTPELVVTVHSPLEVINYDGPAQELAEIASQATGIPVDVDLGPYPGSFGSYSGLDLQIPTITLETNGSINNRAGHVKWLQVEQLALEWAAKQGSSSGVLLSEAVLEHDDSKEFLAIGMGDSAGGRPLVAEQFGTEGKPLLVVAALDGSDMSAFAAERFRALLLGRLGQAAAQRKIILLSVANPDGHADSQPQNADGLNPDKSFESGFVPGDDAGSDPFQSVEASAIRDLIQTQHVVAVVVLQSSQEQLMVGIDGPADTMREAAGDVLYTSYQALDSNRPGSLAAWTGSLGIASLTIAVPILPQDIDLLRADNLARVLLAVAEAAPKF